MQYIEEDQKAGKKQKILTELNNSAPKKRKSAMLAPAEAKVQDVLEKTVCTCSWCYKNIEGYD
jgi:hypothetical protein